MSVWSQSISEIVDDERLTHAVGRRPVPSSAVAEELRGSRENSSFLATGDEGEGMVDDGEEQLWVHFCLVGCSMFRLTQKIE